MGWGSGLARLGKGLHQGSAAGQCLETDWGRRGQEGACWAPRLPRSQVPFHLADLSPSGDQPKLAHD